MFDYLQQFKRLPKELRQKVSSDLAMEVLTELEKKYNVALAAIVMKVMVKNVLVSQLPAYFVAEFNLQPSEAQKLSDELRKRLFFVVANYLGLKPELSNIERQAQDVLKEAKIIFPSEELQVRCKKVLASYLRGVRSKLDTRSSLQKPINIGGLNLNSQETDLLLTIANRKMANLNGKKEEEKKSEEKKEKLDNIINQADKSGSEGYNLKKEIASGRTPSLQKKEEIKLIEKADSIKQIEEVKHKSIEAPKVEEKKEDKEIKEVAKEEVKIEKVKEEKTESFAPSKNKLFAKKKEEQVKKEVHSDFKPGISLPSSRPAAGSDAKLKVEDIKVAPKIMGPIEELRYLDLDNFRRLGSSAQEITEKIQKKIKLLERDGYDKRLQAFEAWRKSPVNRLYLTIGQLAISQGVSLEEATLNRKEKYPESLSIEEIKAIVNLNSSLMF
jgi:hypothetical protein